MLNNVQQEPYALYFLNGIAYITYYDQKFIGEMTLDDIYTLTMTNDINGIDRSEVNSLNTYIDNGVTTYSFVLITEEFTDIIENAKLSLNFNDKTDSYKMMNNKIVIEFNENGDLIYTKLELSIEYTVSNEIIDYYLISERSYENINNTIIDLPDNFDDYH